MQPFAHPDHGEHPEISVRLVYRQSRYREDEQGHHLLDHLELWQIEAPIAVGVGGDHQAVLEPEAGAKGHEREATARRTTAREVRS